MDRGQELVTLDGAPSVRQQAADSATSNLEGTLAMPSTASNSPSPLLHAG
jgi:hypothetical protein